MSEEVVIVPDEIIGAAYDHFVDMFYPGGSGKGHQFWAFLGMKKPGSYYGTYPWKLPVQAAHNAHLLASPHYQTIARAMLIRGYRYDREV